MNTNINTDNYEAYLIDYMDGNLGPDEMRQLRAFITAQGLDWDELTEELPQLEAPKIEFEDKERLKKRSLSPSKGRPNRTIIPLYVKIASAAAAAGLLLTVSLWPEQSRPKLEPIAELKLIEAHSIMSEPEVLKLPKRPILFANPQVVVKEKAVISERAELPLIVELEPIHASEAHIALPTALADKSDFDGLTFRMNHNIVLAPYTEDPFEPFEEDEDSRSLISKGLLWLTNGRHSNFASLIGSGVHKAKQGLTDAATDASLAAYYRADERFEEIKEHWEEKLKP